MIVTDPQIEEFRKFWAIPKNRKGTLQAMQRNRMRQGLRIALRHYSLIPRIARNYLLSLTGKFPLRSLEIAVGYECNYSCEQCSCALSRNDSRTRLSMLEFKDVVDQAISMGAFQFNLNGGEPLIYFDEILELCSHIRHSGAYVHMATNGSLLDFQRLSELKSAGLCSFEMGLDSSIPERHDDNRSPGSFTKIMENTESAKSLSIDVAFNTVGTKQKIYDGDLINTIYLAKQMGVLLMITPPCMTGRWTGRWDILLDDEEQGYIRWLLAKFPFTRIDNYNGLRGLSCPAAREKMGMTPYGDVLSCPLIQISYGNIKDKPLRKIQLNMLQDSYYHKKLIDGCLPSHDRDFIRDRLINIRDKQIET